MQRRVSLQPRVEGEQRLRRALRLVKQLHVAGEVRHAQRRQTVLPRAEEVARAAQLQILLRQRKAALRAAHRVEPRFIVLAAVVGNEDAIRLPWPAPHAPAQLMELREPEALRVLDEHDRGVRHVHADLHHRGGNEHVDLARGERAHDRFLFLRFHFSMQKAHRSVRKHLFLQFFRIGGHRLALVGQLAVLLHHRADDVGLPSLRELLFEEGVDALMVARRHSVGLDAPPSRRQLVDHRNVEVAVDHQRQRARDGRCGHDEQVRVLTLGTQRRALVHAEAVLLVGHDQPEVLIRNVRREQRVRADGKVDLPRRELL